jgi:hypothetical protein
VSYWYRLFDAGTTFYRLSAEAYFFMFISDEKDGDPPSQRGGDR